MVRILWGPRNHSRVFTEQFRDANGTVPGCPLVRSGLFMEFPGFPLKYSGVSMESVRLSQSIPGKLSVYILLGFSRDFPGIFVRVPGKSTAEGRASASGVGGCTIQSPAGSY